MNPIYKRTLSIIILFVFLISSCGITYAENITIKHSKYKSSDYIALGTPANIKRI